MANTERQYVMQYTLFASRFCYKYEGKIKSDTCFILGISCNRELLDHIEIIPRSFPLPLLPPAFRCVRVKSPLAHMLNQKCMTREPKEIRYIIHGVGVI